MTTPLITLENEFWQAGILPATGASVAFGRIRHAARWVDMMRPTAEADYGNSSKSSSFIMLPWCNRIRNGELRFGDAVYQLKTAPDDGTARHGDVRNRVWRVSMADNTSVVLRFDSREHEGVNFPFHFSAQADYALEGRDFVWRLTLRNEDTQSMPAGFGYHPYFVRPTGAEAQPAVAIPCEAAFELTEYMASAPPVPIPPRLDFRQLRRLDETELNDLLTHRQGSVPVRMVYPEWELTMTSDPIYKHILIYAPQGQPFYAIEPMTNASDGFNLYEQGIEDSGVFVLQPGEAVSGEVRLRFEA